MSPEPWTAGIEDLVRYKHDVVADANGRTVCTLPATGPGEINTDDARLLARAPRMRNLLRLLLTAPKACQYDAVKSAARALLAEVGG